LFLNQEQLENITSNPLTLVSAPAGFGKTTLITQWITSKKPPLQVAWIQLDENDNDPVRFWDYFIEAMQGRQSSVGQVAAAMLHAPLPLPIEAILTPLINDLSTISEDMILVLDDFQTIKSEPIHTGVTFLLDHLPPRLHLVIATRVDPPLPLPRFRGRGSMLEIGADDLRFTVEEAAGLLNNILKVDLKAGDINALTVRTEGWAVGLMMAALSIGKGKDVTQFVANFTGSQRYIMDYLIEEVLGRQSDEVQGFFLRTSVLERLTGPLCDFVAGLEGSQEMLENLERSNLFLIPLDESRQVGSEDPGG
jgi:LuxR family maltose regulon positive regulatory protein